MDKSALISKVLSGYADRREQQELDQWINESRNNREEFENIRLLDEHLKRAAGIPPSGWQAAGMLKIKRVLKKRIRKRQRVAMILIPLAAAVIAFLSAWFLLVTPNASAPKSVVFVDSRLKDVVAVLQDEFSVTITVSTPEVLECPVTASFYGPSDEEGMLKELASSVGLHCVKVKDGHYQLEGKGNCSAMQ